MQKVNGIFKEKSLFQYLNLNSQEELLQLEATFYICFCVYAIHKSK